MLNVFYVCISRFARKKQTNHDGTRISKRRFLDFLDDSRLLHSCAENSKRHDVTILIAPRALFAGVFKRQTETSNRRFASTEQACVNRESPDEHPRFDSFVWCNDCVWRFERSLKAHDEGKKKINPSATSGIARTVAVGSFWPTRKLSLRWEKWEK